MQATVTGLFVYPVKSTRGIAHSRVAVTVTGFEWDRQWMIVNANGVFLTQRSHPQMARLTSEVRNDTLVLNFPGLPALPVPLDADGESLRVRIFEHSCVALDQGIEAAEWLSRALGEPLRLTRVAPYTGRLANPKFAGAATPVPITFTDGYPVLVCNEASLEDLNARMPEPIPMERFRPNIVLKGLPAWAEDHIETIAIGAVTLRLVKPCVRCTIPSVDQQTGARSTDPTPVLKTFRNNRELRGVMFGENAVIVRGVGATLAVGDSAAATHGARSALSVS